MMLERTTGLYQENSSPQAETISGHGLVIGLHGLKPRERARVAKSRLLPATTQLTKLPGNKPQSDSQRSACLIVHDWRCAAGTNTREADLWFGGSKRSAALTASNLCRACGARDTGRALEQLINEQLNHFSRRRRQ